MNESNITAHDISIYCSPFLTNKAIQALNVRTYSLLHQYNKSLGGGSYVRHIALVKFFGLSCNIDEVGEIAQILCSKINVLAEKDYIMATLTPPLTIPFRDHTGSEYYKKCAVMFYAALTPEGEEYIKEHMAYLENKEGEVPKICSAEIEEFSKDTGTYVISEE